MVLIPEKIIKYYYIYLKHILKTNNLINDSKNCKGVPF